MSANLRFSVALHILTLLAADGTKPLTSEEIASISSQILLSWPSSSEEIRAAAIPAA